MHETFRTSQRTAVAKAARSKKNNSNQQDAAFASGRCHICERDQSPRLDGNGKGSVNPRDKLALLATKVQASTALIWDITLHAPIGTPSDLN